MDTISSWYSIAGYFRPKVFVFLIFSFYLFLSVFALGYSEILAGVLLLAGFSVFKGYKSKLQLYPVMLLEKWLLIIFALYALVSIFSFLYWPMTRDAHMRIEDDLKFLMFIPLYLMLRQYRFSSRHLMILFSVLVITMGIVSLGQFFNISPISDLYRPSSRPAADVNPMRYATIALLMVCFTLNYWVTINRKINRKIKITVLVISIVLGLIACFLTQTRGVWLAIPLLALLYCYYLQRRFGLRHAFIISIVAILFLGLSSQTSFFQNRFDRTVSNIKHYVSGNGHSSLGIRLDMYKASFILTKEKPLFGHGLGVFKEKSKELRVNGELGDGVHRAVGMRRTPHNEFFQATVERGIVGLIVTILLFLVPGFIFYRAVKARSEKITYYGLCGMSVLVVFFVAGQTGTLFNHNLFTNFYVIMTFLFVSQIRVLEDQEEETILSLGIFPRLNS